MLRIRLTRVGKKKQPAYRIVVADSRSPRDGSFLKIIGHYNPLTEPATLVVKEEEAVHWLEKGAKPSDTAAKLLTRIGVMERAGRPPMRYEGKDVAPKPKKEAKAEAAPAEPKARAQTKAPAAEVAAEPAAEAETVLEETEAPEPAPESAATEESAPSEDAAEEQPDTAVQEPEREEAKTETEPEATSEEQNQEQAENQE